MPTSNQQTDTNNNSNNKIINGTASLTSATAATAAAVEVVAAEADMAGATALLLAAAGNHQPLVASSPCTTTSTNNDLISSIKNHEHHQQQQQQQPVLNNNKSNNHMLNNNNINNNNNKTTAQRSRQHKNNQHPNATNNNKTHLSPNGHTPTRTLEELTALLRDFKFDRTLLTNEELIRLVKNNQVSIYKLENFLGKDNAARCVEIRRDFYRLELDELDKHDLLGIRDRANALINKLKYEDLDYERVNGACCENVIGHVKIPVGLAGPLILDGEAIFVPLATTEGCLVASTCRGLSALRKSGGVTSRIRRDFMTRAPIIRFNDITLNDALDNVERAIMWLNNPVNKEKMRAAFNLTSSHGKFINYTMYPVNREIHIRFEAQTGDAMGMNMCSKGVESALKEMQRAFPSMEIITLSGNMCTDKKAAGINWINGRGKAVECNAELPSHVVKQVFKVSVDQLVDRWKSKVMIGSALAASIGGFNSQAANILTAIFIATGQDPAQNVTSSNCMLILEKDSKGSLVVCCTMPSIECGTVGGGTILGDQSRYLQMMGVKGPTPKLNKQQHRFLQNNKMHRQPSGQIITNGGGVHAASPPSRGQFNSSSTNLHETKTNSYGGSTVAYSDKVRDEDSSSPCSSESSLSNTSNVMDTNEYTNARKLARIICATVMAGELSLLAALTEGTLVKSHMRHNRSSTNVITTNTPDSHLDGGGGGGGGLFPASQSCFGPLGNINNTTVINQNHHSHLKSIPSAHDDHYINNSYDISNSSQVSPALAATISNNNQSDSSIGLDGALGLGGNRLC